MKRTHSKTLELISARPVSGSVRWADIESLFLELGATVTEREGSRIAVVLVVKRRSITARIPAHDRQRRRRQRPQVARIKRSEAMNIFEHRQLPCSRYL